MDLDKLQNDVLCLSENIHPNSRFLIEKQFEKRFGDTADVCMTLWNTGTIKLYGQYFLEAEIKEHDVVIFNLCLENEFGYEYLTDIGIQDYNELVHVLQNYLNELLWN